MLDLVNMDNEISSFIKCKHRLCHQNNLSASEDVLCTLQQVKGNDKLIKCYFQYFKLLF